jgi:hypothetical protein
MAVAAGEGTVFQVEGTAAQERRIEVVNLDLANSLTARYEESNDGVTFTDVAADALLAPGQTRVDVLTGSVFFRLRGSGSLDIAVRVTSSKAIVANTFITR